MPAAHLKYVGHAALTARLLDSDPSWTWEPLAFKDGLPAFDSQGGLWIRLTVCGVTRLGYGNAASSSFKDVGAREKEVIGDALRNAAMRFGAALELWHKGELYVDGDENKEAEGKDQEAQGRELDSSDKASEAKPDRKPATAKEAIESLQKTIKENGPKPDLSGYVITFGKHKNKKLSELTDAAILQYRNYIVSSSEKDNKPLKGQVLDFVEKATDFLKTQGYDFSPINSMTQNNEEVPF